MSDKLKLLFDEVLDPLIRTDGGRIELLTVEGKRVRVRLHGTCLGCPGKPYTLSRIVEPAVKLWLGDEFVVDAED